MKKRILAGLSAFCLLAILPMTAFAVAAQSGESEISSLVGDGEDKTALNETADAVTDAEAVSSLESLIDAFLSAYENGGELDAL